MNAQVDTLLYAYINKQTNCGLVIRAIQLFVKYRGRDSKTGAVEYYWPITGHLVLIPEERQVRHAGSSGIECKWGTLLLNFKLDWLRA